MYRTNSGFTSFVYTYVLVHSGSNLQHRPRTFRVTGCSKRYQQHHCGRGLRLCGVWAVGQGSDDITTCCCIHSIEQIQGFPSLQIQEWLALDTLMPNNLASCLASIFCCHFSNEIRAPLFKYSYWQVMRLLIREWAGHPPVCLTMCIERVWPPIYIISELVEWSLQHFTGWMKQVPTLWYCEDQKSPITGNVL